MKRTDFCHNPGNFVWGPSVLMNYSNFASNSISNSPLVLCLMFSSMLLLSMCLISRVWVARSVRIMNITPIFTIWHRNFRLWRWNFVLQANIFWKARDGKGLIPREFHMEIQLMLELKSLLWSSANSNRSFKQVSWKNSPPLQLSLKVTTWLTYRTDKFLRVLYSNECVYSVYSAVQCGRCTMTNRSHPLISRCKNFFARSS